jgi:diacylglycerol O-acyltransferase
LIARVHHAMVDGISGMGLMRVLLDESPGVVRALRPAAGAGVWKPSPLPAASQLLRRAAVHLAQDVMGAGRALLHGLRDPAYGVRTTAEVVTGLTRFGLRLYSRRSTSLQGPIGERRRYAYKVVRMADLSEIRLAFGCTINDVVLTLLSGGYRALLLAQGDRVEQAHVRSLVPVSVRGREAAGKLDNRVSAVFYNLPVRLRDPGERLRSVMQQMVRLKQAHMVEAGVWFTHAGDFVPPLLVGSVSRIVAHVMHRHPQRIVSTVTTNVPGPRMPLYLLGRKLVHWLPHVPITQGARVGSACISYGGELAFGVTADYASIPDLSVFTAAIAADFNALLAQVRVPLQPTVQPTAEEL